MAEVAYGQGSALLARGTLSLAASQERPRGGCAVLLAIPCLAIGGTEHQTIAMAGALCSLKRRPSVVSYFESAPETVQAFESLGVRVVNLSWPRTIHAGTFVRRLAQVIRDLAPDILHVQYIAPGLLPIVAGRLAGVRRVLTTVHRVCDPQDSKARILARVAARLSDRFVCVSGAVERSWFGTSVEVHPTGPWPLNRSHATITNALDTDSIDCMLSTSPAQALGTLGVGGCGLIIGTVARFVAAKGVDTLIRAFAMVVAMRRATLLLVGSGPEEGALRALASTLNVSDQIVWTGEQDRKVSIQLLSIMDIVVVPSRTEGFGLVAAEAMTCGRPVIASHVGGLPDLVVDGTTGVLFPAESPAALAKALVALLGSAGLRGRLGKGGRDRIISRFSYRDYVARMGILHEI